MARVQTRKRIAAVHYNLLNYFWRGYSALNLMKFTYIIQMLKSIVWVENGEQCSNDMCIQKYGSTQKNPRYIKPMQENSFKLVVILLSFIK